MSGMLWWGQAFFQMPSIFLTLFPTLKGICTDSDEISRGLRVFAVGFLLTAQLSRRMRALPLVVTASPAAHLHEVGSHVLNRRLSLKTNDCRLLWGYKFLQDKKQNALKEKKWRKEILLCFLKRSRFFSIVLSCYSFFNLNNLIINMVNQNQHLPVRNTMKSKAS